MSPEEKARELVRNYFDKLSDTLSDRYSRLLAKECAVVAVDEILENFGTLTGGSQHYAAQCTIEFYEEVKIQIIKL